MPGENIISPKDLGERLRAAREAANITQAGSATKIGVARTTLVAIEKGERQIRMEELQRLAQLYGTSANALLRRESVHPDILPCFRKLRSTTNQATESAARLMVDLVRSEVELESLLGIKRPRNYPPERPIIPGDLERHAEDDATELRQWLGLGQSPVRDIVTLLEMDLGVRVYVYRLDAKIAGAFAYDEAFGACMLLNAAHPRERRTQTAAHELGHMISTRNTAKMFRTNEVGRSKEERYADAFGRAFLTPSRPVTQRFREITEGSDRLTRRHVILLAHGFGVSREAMVRRLEELRLTKAGTWNWFESHGGITDEHARQVLGDLLPADSEATVGQHPTTLWLNQLAYEAWRRNLLSEGQLARLLHLDRVTLREILVDRDIERSEADELPKLPG